MNLKLALMTLGNHLVLKHSFDPPVQPITKFTEWLNDQPERIEFLKKQGVYWPVRGESSETPANPAAMKNFKVIFYALMKTTSFNDRDPIWDLDRFLNNTPEAREFLREQNIDWSVMDTIAQLMGKAEKLLRDTGYEDKT